MTRGYLLAESKTIKRTNRQKIDYFLFQAFSSPFLHLVITASTHPLLTSAHYQNILKEASASGCAIGAGYVN